MKLKKVMEKFSRFASFEWADKWDNSGLIVGDPEWDISKILVCLDASLPALSSAMERDYDLLISHHPLIFNPLKRLDLSRTLPKTIAKALNENIAIVSLHTNWDYSPYGMNVILADTLEMKDVQPLLNTESDSWGAGAIGQIEGIIMHEIIRKISKIWDLSWQRGYGFSDKLVRRVALCGGSGGDMWEYALQSKADLFITADIKYHQIVEAVSEGLGILVVDHGEMERQSLPRLVSIVSERTGLYVSEYEELPLGKYQILL